MPVIVIGLSHHSSPVALREQVSFPEADLPTALRKLKARLPGGGCVILSTCNRVELYAHAEMPGDELQDCVRGFVRNFHGLGDALPDDALYTHQDRNAVTHLFRVAASLDSMVVGENEIVGQVHDAYLAAHEHGATDKVLSGLFQRAFKVAKEVRTKSSIGAGKVSVASVAVDLAVSIFTDLTDKAVLIIGSGETGELALKTLLSRGARKIFVMNRTVEKARELASQYGGEALPLSELSDHLHRADIVITSTASPTPILTADAFHAALRARAQAPMFVIDIAVPRDVAPEVNALDNVYLYDIDNLQRVADQNLEARRSEMARCVEMVEAQADRFMRWRLSLYAEPTIVSMAQELHAIRERELEKTLAVLSDLTDKQREEVKYLSQRIVNSILQRPMTQIKQEVSEDDPNTVLHLVKRLFGLEESA